MNKILPPSETPTYRRIKREIDLWVKIASGDSPNFGRWYCGITNDPRARKSKHATKSGMKPFLFCAWDAKSLRIAKTLETSFHKKGMKDQDSKGGAKKDSKFIYVFKQRPTLLDYLFQ